MPVIPALTTFTASTLVKSAEVNNNFSTIRTTLNTYGMFTDVAATVTAIHTYNATPIFTTGITVSAGGVTVSAGGITVTGNSTITGTLSGLTGLTVASGGLTVSAGGAAITGDSTITGNLTVTDTLTYGTISVPAGSVTAGTFDTGNYTINGTLTATSVLASGGQMRATRATQTGAGGTVSFSAANHVRHTMTGNGTLTLSGGVAGGVYTLEVLQDGTGGRTVTWSGAVWPANSTPVVTSTANRKDVYTFFFDGSSYLGVQFGANYASTA